MKRIYLPSAGASSWRALLAEPDLHWKRGASAMELAVSWELAAATERGLPPEVADVLDLHEATRGARLIFGAPEHRVPLPGGRRASQTDLWAVATTPGGLVSIAVEGKAGEPFGPTISAWLQDDSAGKRVRLDALCEVLGVAVAADSALRYQLLHRSASAVMEAERIGARTAVMLVQNFRPETSSWADFESFVAHFGGTAARRGICDTTCRQHVQLLLAWTEVFCRPTHNWRRHGRRSYPIVRDSDARDRRMGTTRAGRHQPRQTPIAAVSTRRRSA